MKGEGRRLPSVGTIVSYLVEGCGDFCVDMPSGARSMPEEIWIADLSCWLRADGSSVNGDITYDFARRYHGPVSRWRIRRAITRFRRLVELFPERIAA
jgi:hypothetical protein